MKFLAVAGGFVPLATITSIKVSGTVVRAYVSSGDLHYHELGVFETRADAWRAARSLVQSLGTIVGEDIV